MKEPDGLRLKTDDEVREILAGLRTRLEGVYGDRLRGIYLFGSYARGEADAESDIDALVVLDEVQSYWEEIKRTSHARADLSLQHDTSISLVYVSEDRWSNEDTPFLSNVRREGRAA